MIKTWFITGASRGFGVQFSRAALSAGHNVVATGREAGAVSRAIGESDMLLTLAVDVTKPATVASGVQSAIERFGSIDVLVNNAGYGQLGAFEELSENAIEKQFATNFFGSLNVTRAVLPQMRKQHSGHIISISSIAGVSGGSYYSVYSASKFALAGWMESLHAELAGFGIRTTIVEPGYFRTEFLQPNSVSFGDLSIADYTEQSKAVEARFRAHSNKQAGDPVKLAAVLMKLAEMESPPLHFGAGSDAVGVMLSKSEALRKEAEQWRAMSVSTDFTS